MTRNRFNRIFHGATRAGALAAIAACADRAPMAPELSPERGPSFLTAAQTNAIGAGLYASLGDAGTTQTYPLYAGGGGTGAGTLVGNVTITQTDAVGPVYGFSVSYDITNAGWCLVESHVGIALDPATLGGKSGNPAPGQLGTSSSHSCASSYTYQNVTLDVTGAPADQNVAVIAAHAVVSQATTVGGGSFVSGGSLAANVTARRSGNVSGFSAVNAPVVDAWEAFGDPADATPSLWDEAIVADPSIDLNGRTGASNGQWLLDNGADWVWESYRSNGVVTTDAVNGSVIRMEATVNVPVAQGGVFRITCDNAYRVDFKGAPISSPDGATAGYGTQMSSTLFNALATTTNLKQANVSADGWESTESYNVSLSAGANTFTIYAANEYQNTDDAHTGYPVGPRARPATNDPAGSPDSNPAGCIFGLQANGARTPTGGTETAWGALRESQGFTGNENQPGNFSGNNWATYMLFRFR